MTTVAIMQPYIFPYIGYFQLLKAVDVFVILDDVNYINRGWINRNRILLNGDPYVFTIPLQHASQNRMICEIELQNDTVWRDKFLRTIRHAYGKAPFYEQVRPLLENIIGYPSWRLDAFLRQSLRKIVNYLGLESNIIGSSTVYENSCLRGQARLIDICQKEGASRYINAIGGRALYNPEEFIFAGIDLKFIQPRAITYRQFADRHVPWLSIIDVLMFNSKRDVNVILSEYDLVL